MKAESDSFIKHNLLLFAFLLGAIILFFYWQSLESNLFEQEQKLFEFELSYKNIQKNKLRGKNLDQDFKKLQKIENLIHKELLDPSNKTQVYGFFLDAEESSGAKIDEPSLIKEQLVFKPKKGNAIYSYTFRLVANGFFEQLLRLIDALEHGERIGFAKSIKMSVTPVNEVVPNDAPIHCVFEISVLGKEK